MTDQINIVWDAANITDRANMILDNKLSQEFIMDHWDEMTSWFRHLCCGLYLLPFSFIEAKWEQMTSVCQISCWRHQLLDEEFIAKHLRYLSSPVQIDCLQNQNLDTEFIVEHWNDLTDKTKIEFLTQYNTSFLNKLQLGQLPQFLTDQNGIVRMLAGRRLQEVEMCKKCE